MKEFEEWAQAPIFSGKKWGNLPFKRVAISIQIIIRPGNITPFFHFALKLERQALLAQHKHYYL